MNILRELTWRGLMNTITDVRLHHELDTPQTVYAGFDPTADSLHVGHLMALMVLRRFQQAGHRPIVLLGGATGMIGDPSGKSEERNLLEVDVLDRNIAGITAQVDRLLGAKIASGYDWLQRDFILVNNNDWMHDWKYLDFLRIVGKHFPVNVMMTKDSVKSRLDTGLSYTEFSYMLLQAYDFVHLHEQFGCTLQIGGSDQWGNITAGIDLARRMHGQQLYGLTCPLLTKSDGTKMGKTDSGTVWLAADKTCPYDFYNFWFNLDDADVERCLGYFTDLSRDEITIVMAEHQKKPERRTAQTRLAEELTALVHGL